MIRITITLVEALGANQTQVSSQVTEAIYNALEQPAIAALFIHSSAKVEMGTKPEFYPSEPSSKKGVVKTEANSCQLRYLGGRWVISELSGDHSFVGIDAVIRHINLKRLYLTSEQIMTAEYAEQLWYKRKA